MRVIQPALQVLAVSSLLLLAACATKHRIPPEIIDLAPGRTDKAFIQLSVKKYKSKYMTEVFILHDGKKPERVSLIGIGTRDAQEFFRNDHQAKIMQVTFAVAPGKTSFLLRSYDMPKDKPFQAVGEAGKITPVMISKEATETSYLLETLDRRWQVDVLPAITPDP